MTATPVPHDLPSVSPLASLGGIARHGFLETTGRLWRAHGDTFRLRLGVGGMLFAVHPDSVKEVQLADVIAHRRASGVAPRDLLTQLMETRDDEGRPMAKSLLADESITMFFAGHETTARTLAATWAALSAHPRVAQRLHAELDGVLGDRTPTVDDLRALPYTLQVVKEVLRLWPAAPFYVRDAVEDTEVAGHPVPAGTPVMLTPYWTHRHPDFWEDPEVFDPDRFTPEAEKARHPQAYHPFATGERVCIGNHFSLLESHLLLAVLARRFAPRLVGVQPRWVMNGVLSPAGGLPMRIVARAR